MRVSFVECTVNIALPFGALPEPDGPGGGCPSSCEDSMGWLASWLGFPLMRTPVSLCAYVVVEFSLWNDMLAASAFFMFYDSLVFQ